MKGLYLRRVLLVCITGAVITTVLVRADLTLPELLRDTITLSLGVLYEAFPFILLGTLLATIVQLYVPETFLLRFLPKRALLRRSVLSISGSVLPVCECGNVPLARGLMMKGIQPQDALTFILAAPIINPVTALTTHQAFGNQSLLLPLRLLGAFTISNLVGWLFDDSKTKMSLVHKKFEAYCTACLHDHRQSSKKQKLTILKRITEFSIAFQKELSTLIPPLLLGSLTAGLVQTIVPRTILTQIATEPVLAIVVMLVLAFVVSICANVDAFFALSFSGIFPMSAILGFLLFGPMIDMKMLALLRTTYTTKALVLVSSVVFLSCFLFALGAHYVI